MILVMKKVKKEMLEDVIDEKLGQKSAIKNQAGDEKPILK